MGSPREQIVLLLTDLLAISLAWLFYYLIRVRSNWIDLTVQPDVWGPMILMCLFWVLTFLLFGLYKSWYAESRFDEITLLFKATSLGCLFIFFAIFVDDQKGTVRVSSRLLITIYWVILFVVLSFGRIFVRSLQRRMLIAGIGLHETIIVGDWQKVKELNVELQKYPALGYRVVGYVGSEGEVALGGQDGLRMLGTVQDIDVIIDKYDIREVLIALNSSNHVQLLDLISKCNSEKVGIKIIPDLYDIVSGQARTNQIYGFPLIDINPRLLKPWEEALKRGMDICVSIVVLCVGLPLWLLVAFIIKSESPGSVLYQQERVGKDGKVFKIIKFRSMRLDAEASGPQWANKQDPRVTRIGKWLRRLHIDEIPQMWNVLVGSMSLVGPRPERPHFVRELTKQLPMYSRRLKVRPGITGWAQVKHKYDESIEDVKKKIQYDFYYIENISIRMDFKILLSTVYHILLGKGH